MHTGKLPEYARKERVKLNSLLPILADLDQKWYAVEPEMMKTTYKHVHHLNIFLGRQKEKLVETAVLMQEL